MIDEYKFWREALAGNKPQMSEGSPEPGFYRWPKKAAYGARKTFKAVAYWRDADGNMQCAIDDKDAEIQYGTDIWISVGAHPVSYEDYQGYITTGKWHDEHELVAMGSNQPPDDDSYEGLKAAIDDLAREANKLLVANKVAETQAEADQLSNLADRLAELGKRAEDKRKAEKKPHDDAAEAVQAKWKPVVIMAEAYKALKNRLIMPFLAAQEKAARILREEAVATGEPMPEITKPRAGTRGRAMSVRSTKKAKVIDRNAVLEFFRENEMISTSLQILADRAIQAGVSVPGTEVISEDKVV